MKTLKLKLGNCHNNMNFILTNDTNSYSFVQSTDKLINLEINIGFNKINTAIFPLFNSYTYTS